MEKQVYEGVVRKGWVGEGFGHNGSGRDYYIGCKSLTDMVGEISDHRDRRVRITVEIIEDEEHTRRTRNFISELRGKTLKGITRCR